MSTVRAIPLVPEPAQGLPALRWKGDAGGRLRSGAARRAAAPAGARDGAGPAGVREGAGPAGVRQGAGPAGAVRLSGGAEVIPLRRPGSRAVLYERPTP